MEGEHNSLKNDHNALKQELSSLKDDHDALKNEHSSLKIELDSLRNDHKTLQNNFNELVEKFTQSRELTFGFNDEFLSGSSIATSKEEKMYLQTVLVQKRYCLKISTVLLYKGSQNGWQYADFHARADNKGPTITLFKVQDTNLRCGGFTSVNWDSAGSYKAD